MSNLKEFVIKNAALIDTLDWKKLSDAITDSGLMIYDIVKLTDIVAEATNLHGITTLWCFFCAEKNMKTFVIPKTVTELSFNVFYNSEIEQLTLNSNITKIDDDAFYKSSIRKLEMWQTNPIKILIKGVTKQKLEYVRYHGTMLSLLERILLEDFHCTIECDDGHINLDPGFFPEVNWSGDSCDAQEIFSKAKNVLMDEGLVVNCVGDGKTAIWEEDGSFEIV